MEDSAKSSWLGMVKAPVSVYKNTGCAITMPFRDLDYGEVLPPAAEFGKLIHSYANVRRKKDSAKDPTVYPTSDIYICFCRTPDKAVAYLAGPRTKPRYLEYVTDDTNFFIVSLSYRGSYAFLPTHQSELMDKSFLLSDLFPKWGKCLTGQICDADGIEAKVRLFETFLRKHSAMLTPFPDVMTHVINRLSVDNDYTSYIKNVKDIGYTERHVRRLFLKYTGVSPNKYIRTLKCEAAMKTLTANPATPLARVACDLNYCDQTHFIREFKSFYNFTPKQFVKEFLA